MPAFASTLTNDNLSQGDIRTRRKDVSVLIVSWNSERWITDCLGSIASAAKKYAVEVILVDNGSTDSTLQLVRARFPEVHVIENHANLGFARAVNVGSRHATSRYLFLLNPDTRLLPDTIDGLAEFLESHPEAGAVSPKILDRNGLQALFSVRQFPSLTNAVLRQFGLRRLLPGNRLLGCETLAAYDRGRLMVVPCVSGAAIMLPRSLFESVGRLSEDLPMYFEDLELCARVGSLAPIYYFPEATVVHLGRKSMERSPSRSVLVAMENGEAPWMYLRRHSGCWHARVFSALVLIGSFARLIVRGSLLLFVALFGRTRLKYARSQVADVAALLRWCILPRRIFLSLVNSVFTSGQDA